MPTIKLKKITDYIWEIPKGTKPNMKVPTRIYAGRSLIERMEDKTLEQGMNVATLPGIQKYSIILSDAHSGYGFPIGGVGAFDAEKGVISPGGIGYDINCLPGDVRILSPLGYHVPLKDIPLYSRVTTVSDQPTASRVIYRIKRVEGNVLVIKTKSGHLLRATRDHPILTRRGMVVTDKLDEGEMVALYPFVGQPYEEPPNTILLDEDDFNPRIAFELKRRGLLPLRASSDKFPLLVRILGYFMGDGSFSGKMVWFYGSPEGLEEIRKDIYRLGYSPTKIYHRIRRSKIEEKEFTGEEYSFYVSAKSFKDLLVALGAPLGKKTFSDYGVPEWLFKMPNWIKRLFLAGYFGAKLEAPHSSNGYNFNDLSITIIKHVDHEDSGVEFLLGIKKLLAGLGIETNNIYRMRYGDRVLLRLPISSKPRNLVRLWTTVGYDYNPNRRHLALAAATYLMYKLEVKEYREKVMLQAIQMHESGASLSNIVDELGDNYAGRRYIERSIYEGRGEVRIPSDFPKFHEWLANHFDGVRVWDEITSIEEVEYNDYVYDITVDNPHHNFVADGFIVSNCGVRVMVTDLSVRDVQPRIRELADALFRNVPAGLGSRRRDFRVSMRELDEVAVGGARYIIEKFGLGWDEDPEFIEENGAMPGADPSRVSNAAKRRGLDQLGTLGSGNHFLEIQKVDRIFDERIARALGITHVGQVTVMVHTGSRGYGHQVCTDYLKIMDRLIHRLGIRLVDRELVYAPVDSREAQDYWKAFCSAVNFAFANRQAISHWVRESFGKVYGTDPEKLGLRIVYDVAHNIAKLEEHDVDGRRVRVYVHRKGATRSLPPNHPLTPRQYKDIGQPVLIPGSMGTASYILIGLPTSLERSFASAPHGSGRVMSRAAAKRRFRAEQIVRNLERKGITIRAESRATITEETDEAYKSADEVSLSAEMAGLAKRVVRLVPLAVVKG